MPSSYFRIWRNYCIVHCGLWYGQHLLHWGNVSLPLVSSGVCPEGMEMSIPRNTPAKGEYISDSADHSFKKWVNAPPAFGLDCEGDWDTVWTDGKCAHQTVWVQIQDIKTQHGQEAKASVNLLRYSELRGYCGRMTFGHQHGFRFSSRTEVSA